MKLVYIAHFEALSPVFHDQLRVFDSFEKAKKYIESIPGIEERYSGFWECLDAGANNENLFNLGTYSILIKEVE